MDGSGLREHNENIFAHPESRSVLKKVELRVASPTEVNKATEIST
jgi:hypothetical protein